VAEAARTRTGKTITARLEAGAADIDIGGPMAQTLAYNKQLPGPLIRANVGDDIAVTVDNRLDHSNINALARTCAAPATPNVNPRNTYRFSSPYPGAYWAHPHTGLDTDYGLYAAMISTIPRTRAATTPNGS
jgi:FtsP/CotA-like multicopper oxidase with cupredoxin domain